MKRGTLTFLAMALGLLLLPSGCRKEREHQIRIGYQPLAANAPLYVGMHTGAYKDAGLDCKLVPFQSAVAAMYALQRGEVDVLFAPPLNNIADALAKAPGSFRVVAIHGNDDTHFFEAFLARKSSPIKDLAEFKEGSVGCFPGNFAEKIARRILQDYGVGESVVFKKLDLSAQLGALEGGSVDLLFAFEPLVSIAESKGIAKVLEASPITKHFFSPFPVSGVCISSEFVNKRRETAALFVKTNNAVMEKISRRPGTMADPLAAFTQLEPGLAQRISQVYFSRVTLAQRAATEKVLRLFRDLGVIEALPDMDTLFYEAH
ncbi:MAG: ABC transporter substrate-binding protein [bacterium]|nr:ABC transporter substrate-binding protein [bacterium]